MPSIVKFVPGDPFFDPVSAFFASWIGYHGMLATQKHDVVSGRLRGFVIPQLRFDDDPIIGIIRRQENITKVEFTIDMTDPGTPQGQQVRSGRLMEFWCQQMFGHAYETALDKIQQKFGTDRKKQWASTLQVAYHIRNGCFHGNTFDIRPDSISQFIPTEWRGRRIDYSDDNKKVAVEFFGPADFITLLFDVQELLK